MDRRATSPRAESVSSAGLTGPDGVAFDAAGDLIIADTGNDVIRLIPAVARTVFGMPVQPGHIYTIAGNMNYGYTGNGGLGTSAQLQLDTFNGVAVDAKGDVVFSDVDNEVVRLVAAATGDRLRPRRQGRATSTRSRGPGPRGSKATRSPPPRPGWTRPKGVAVDAAGDLFISDSANNLIRFVPAAKGTLRRHGGQGRATSTRSPEWQRRLPGNGVPATTAALTARQRGVGPSGRLLVVDNGNNVIREITGTPRASRR